MQVFRDVVSLRLPAEKIAEIDRLAARHGFRSRTALIEAALDAFVEQVKAANIVVVREMSVAEAKKKMTAYLRARPSALVSDMADELGIDIETAFKAAAELAKEKRVGPA